VVFKSPKIVSTDPLAAEVPKSDCVHLVAFTRPPSVDVAAPAATALWRWKEEVLGDGNDRFVPRPRVTRRLAATILADAPLSLPLVECAVLGNCARLEIYAVTSAPVAADAVRHYVAAHLGRQVAAFQESQHRQPWFKLPDHEAAVWWPPENPAPIPEGSPHLKVLLVTESGAAAVTRHCCAVAAGLTGVDGRPFNPFSSREAHVMLQLKRTLEAVSRPATPPPLFGSPDAWSLPPPCGPRLRIILRAALEAGKAARNPASVPAILPLKGYGGNGRFSPPFSAAPAAARAAALSAAWELAVEPAVARCMAELKAQGNGAAIALLHQQTAALLARSEPDTDPRTMAAVRRAVARALHEPTLRLRAGDDVDPTEILADVRRLIASLT